jgi:hypothetical protein
MIEVIEEQAEQKPGEVLADSGYCSEDNFKYLARRHIDGYVATERQKHGSDRPACKRGPLPKGANAVERMKRKLQTQVGRRIYAMRKGHCGAGIRTDQAGARIPAISVARS